MPIWIYEAADSGNDLTFGVQGGGVTLRWIVTGTDLKEDALVLLLATAPTFHLGFVRENYTVDWLGGPNWKGNVHYGVKGLGGSGEPVGVAPTNPTAPGGGGGGTQDVPLAGGYSFDTTGRTVKITHSLETVTVATPTGEDLRDFERAINVSDGKVEGVDVPAPSLRWSRTVARAALTMGYVRTLTNATGKTNDAEFYGFAALSLTYMGGVGQWNESEGWSVTHHFEHIENDVNDIEVGENITVVGGKKGSEYLWVYYLEKKDALTNEVVLHPRQANVEKVLKPWNFATLEIGT